MCMHLKHAETPIESMYVALSKVEGDYAEYLVAWREQVNDEFKMNSLQLNQLIYYLVSIYCFSMVLSVN